MCEHACGEVQADGPEPLASQLLTEVAGAAREICDQRAARQPQLAHGAPAPVYVEPERHQPVEKVVTNRDAVEHRLDRLRLARLVR